MLSPFRGLSAQGSSQDAYLGILHASGKWF